MGLNGSDPVVTETNQRPLVIALASNRGNMSIGAICAPVRPIATSNLACKDGIS
jgi:hypothetical protein